MCIELLPTLYMNLINIISQAMYQMLHLKHNKMCQIKNYEQWTPNQRAYSWKENEMETRWEKKKKETTESPCRQKPLA